MVEKNRLMLMVESISKSSTGVLADLTSKAAMKVLQVDDDLNYLKVAKQCLEMQSRFRVDTARSAEEAMEKMKKETYDAIISDYQMPGKNGLEFLKELREKGNGTPFIIFTGKGREEVAIKALNLGADGYFNKHGEPETVYGELAHGIRQAVERKKTEMKIWEREERLRAVFSSSPDAITVSDLHGNILDCNEAAWKMLGFSSKEEVVGKSSFDFIAKKDRQKAMENLKKTLEQGTTRNVEYTLLNKDGEEFWGELSASISKNSLGNPLGFVGVIRDTSERKEVEEQIKKVHKEVLRAFDVISDFVFIIDRDYRLVRVNKKVCEALKKKPEKLVGKRCYEVMHRTDKPWPNCPYRKTLETKEASSAEIDDPNIGMPLLVTTSPIFDEEGEFVQCVHTAKDITEHKKAEQTFKESEEKYRSLVELAPDGIVAVNTEGIVTSANRSFLTLVGYDSEEIVGKPFMELKTMRLEDIPKFQEMFSSLMNGEPLSPVEFLYVRRDGTSRWAEVHPGLLIKDGKPVGVQVIMRDVSERKNAEKLIQESQQKFEQLFMSNPEAAVYVDPNERVVNVNPRFTELFGYSFDEVKGKLLDDFVVPEDRRKEAFMLTQKGKEGYVYYETVRKNKKGSLIPVTLSTAPIVLQGRHLGGIVLYRDITERKKVEDALREAKEKWASLTENSDDIVMIVGGNGVIQYINRTIPPYTPEETVGKTVYEYVPREQHNVLEKSLREVFKTGKPDSYQVSSNIQKIGTIWFSTKVVPIKHDGKVSGAILISSNITDRKKAEEELRNSEERLSIVFKRAPDAYYLNDLKGNFEDGNKAAEEVTGYARNELIGKSFLKLKLLSRSQVLKAAKLLAMNALGRSTGPDEFVLIRKDGTQVPVEIRTHPAKFKGKTLVLGIARDISERKRMEEKLRVVGSLTRHDVRNKLSAVTGNAYLLRRGLDENPRALERLKDIEAAVRQVERIFEFARIYEKLGVEQLTCLDTKKTLDEATSLFSDLSSVRIVNDCAGLTVLADSLLRQVFYNLIDNSLKYGEKIKQIRVHYEEADSQLKLVYEDDGVGIPRDTRDNLFKEGVGKGTGYGLFMIKRICEVYGWNIQEKGIQGKGVNFVITIPKTNPNGKENYRIVRSR